MLVPFLVASIALALLSEAVPHQRNLLHARQNASTSVLISQHNSEWQKKKCSATITDATANPLDRWLAADTDAAWKAMLSSWKSDGQNSGLNFPEYASHFFGGPDNWNCADIGSTPCSTVITCDQVKYPAGYLILISFSTLHQVHSEYYQALQSGLNDMQNYIGQFSNTFAPQIPDDHVLFKVLVNAFTAISAVSASATWQLFLPAFKLFSNSALYGFSKDITNAAVGSFALSSAKNSIQGHEDALGTQNDVSADLGKFFNAWEQQVVSYVQTLFAGSDDDLSTPVLQDMISSGKALLLPSQMDLGNLTATAEKILYGQLMPAAWSASPQGITPVIIRKAGSCSSSSLDSELVQYFDSHNSMAAGYVCYNNDAFYVINAKYTNGNPWYDPPFNGLAGATHTELDGNRWGGVTLEDIVISSYQGYQLNGNKNGYVMPELSKNVDGAGTEGDFIFQNGIQTPGFFALPICENWQTALSNLDSKKPSGNPFWPCDPPSGFNTGGTKFHVNNGCILVNGEIVCHNAPKSYNIPDPNTSGTTTITIYSKFDGNNRIDQTVVPGCKMTASWPSSYGDVYFGDDNCLYDASGNGVPPWPQCCNDQTTDKVQNPYYKP